MTAVAEGGAIIDNPLPVLAWRHVSALPNEPGQPVTNRFAAGRGRWAAGEILTAGIHAHEILSVRIGILGILAAVTCGAATGRTGGARARNCV